MAPSSLKKMSGVPRMKEGNNASSENPLWGTSVNNDLGLTIFPGSQIRRRDEKRLDTAAHSSPKEAGSEYVGHDLFLDAKIRAKSPSQGKAFPNDANGAKNPPNSDSGPASNPHVTASANRQRPLSLALIAKEDNVVVHLETKCTTVAPSTEHQMGLRENRNAKIYQNHDYSQSCVNHEIRHERPSKRREVAFKPHYNRFHVHHDQDAPGNHAISPEKGNELIAKFGQPFGNTRGGSGSSKRKLHYQTIHEPDIAPACTHQSMILEPEDRAFNSNAPAIATSTLGPLTKIRSFKAKSLAVHYQSPNAWKEKSSDSRLLPDKPAGIRVQVLKSRKGVNRSWTSRSWTSHFPAKRAKFARHVNLPASSLLVALSTPSEDHQHPTDLCALTNYSSTLLSTSLHSYPVLTRAFEHSLDVCTLEENPDTANTGNQRKLARRRSASMPALWSTRASMKMDSSKNLGPASMPTPPREYTSSPAFLTVSSSPSQHNNTALPQTFGGPPYTSINTNVSSSQGAMAVEDFQLNRQRLQIKPNYSYKEVKCLLFDSSKRAQDLRTENTNLLSSNIAMKKDIENLQFENAQMVKQVQHYERNISQKDRQIEAIQQKGISLKQQYKQIWDDYHRLIAALRKVHGTGNPSAIAQGIRRNYAPNTIGPASQGNQPGADASPVQCANRAALPTLRLGFERIPSGFQGHDQPISIPGASESDLTDASNWSLLAQGYAGANHDRANPLQIALNPAHQEANQANLLSQAPVHQRFAATDPSNASTPHCRSTGSIQPNQPLHDSFGTMTTAVQSDDRCIGHVIMEPVTIDLTDESQLPSSSASYSTSKYQTPQSPVKDGHSPFNLLPRPYSLAQHTTGNYVSSRYTPSPPTQNQSPQGQVPVSQDSQSADREAMQIQREAFARMSEKPLSWLRGENPFKKGTRTEQPNGLEIPRRSSQSNAEGYVIFKEPPKAGSVAPLPDTATDRQTKQKAPMKTKVVLTDEAKKERARFYRKTAADKRKREKEAAEPLLRGASVSMHAHKQNRRATKERQRQKQARKPSGEVGPREPQKTLDGQINQGNTGVRQAVDRGSMHRSFSSDHDSLFGDDEDGQMEIGDMEASLEADTSMQENDAVLEDGVDLAYVAELEAQLSAEVDAATGVGFEQSDTFGGEDGYHAGPYESEESEEE